MNSKIVVVGLGKIGSMLLGVLNDSGHEVWGIDSNFEVINNLKNMQIEKFEPSLNDLIEKCDKGKLLIDYEDIPIDIDYYFVIVPTPSLNSGNFEIKFIQHALEEILNHEKSIIKDKKAKVVINSTVTPGSCNELNFPNQDHYFHLIYSPMFIALGDIYKGITSPDVVLIGTHSDSIGQDFVNFAKTYIKNSPSFEVMSIESAEITKIALNSFITFKISFANYIAEISSHFPTSNMDQILGALGSDSRIGKKYLSAGPSYGGPCFPRDNRALSYISESVNVIADLPLATDRLNKFRSNSLINKIIKEIELTEGRTLVLGFSYKIGTNSAEESFGSSLISTLDNVKYKNLVYLADPLVDLTEMNTNLSTLEYSNLDLSNFSLIILCLNLQEILTKLEKYDGKIISLWPIDNSMSLENVTRL